MLNYTSYKGRRIDETAKVKVYLNLHNGKLSVVQKGLVVAHVDSITLMMPTFKVNQAGRERVIREQKKNVHAFVIGYVESVNRDRDTSNMRQITYNPYKFNKFVYKDTLQGLEVLTIYDKAHVTASKGIYVY